MENNARFSNYTGNVMSFYGAEGSISVQNCDIYQTEIIQGKIIVPPTTNRTLNVENCIGYNYNGSVFKSPSGNLFNGVPTTYWRSNRDYAIDTTNNRVFFKTGDAWT